VKIVVYVFAGLAAVFSGGCLLLGAAQFAPLALVLLAVLAANVAAIVAARRDTPAGGAFLIAFGAVDMVLAAILAAILWGDRYLWELSIPAAVILFCKGGAQLLHGLSKRKTRV
jgi:hypothetical protein